MASTFAPFVLNLLFGLFGGPAACHPPPPEPLGSPGVTQVRPLDESPPRNVARLQSAVAMARPAIDLDGLVPDFHGELRWPLSPMSHPTLEPRLDVAPMFAQPGVGWIELCERGVHRRVLPGRAADHQLYLRGWCAAIAGDVDGALAALTRLTTSTVLGAPGAVRTDLATIIASSGDAERATHWLRTYDVRDLGVLDLVAATYVELDRPDDAKEITRLTLDTSTPATDELTCRRLVRRIVLASRDERLLPTQQLKSLASKPKNVDPTCKSLYLAIECWDDPAERCMPHFIEMGIDWKFASLLRAFHRWPRRPARSSEWTALAREAAMAVPLPGAVDLMLTAYDAALSSAAGACPHSLRESMSHTATSMRHRGFTPPPRLAELQTRCQERGRPVPP